MDFTRRGATFSPMAVTPEQAVSALRRRLAEQLPERRLHTTRLRNLLPAVVEVLAREFGVRRVILFGSLVSGFVDRDSDIDLAVEGLPGRSYFAALLRVEAVAGVHVDLIPLEEVSPSLRRLIDDRGEVLHGTG